MLFIYSLPFQIVARGPPPAQGMTTEWPSWGYSKTWRQTERITTGEQFKVCKIESTVNATLFIDFDRVEII